MSTGCVPLFERQLNNSQSKSQNVNKSRNTVFDEACGEKKKEFFKHLNAYRKNKNDENRANLVSSRSAYKKKLYGISILSKINWKVQSFWKQN